MEGAGVFLGCSVGRLVSKEMVQSMADRPIVFALANPDPEISYEDANTARSDVIIASGRSDYPNQVNNVLGFPFIFRGALDAYAAALHERRARKGVTLREARELLRNPNAPGAMMVRAGDTDAFVAGLTYHYPDIPTSSVLRCRSSAPRRASRGWQGSI